MACRGVTDETSLGKVELAKERSTVVLGPYKNNDNTNNNKNNKETNFVTNGSAVPKILLWRGRSWGVGGGGGGGEDETRTQTDGQE